MEAAELAAQQVFGYRLNLEPRHGCTAQVPARHADKRTRTADHPTTAKRSALAFRDLARRYNSRSQARSLTQLQEIMHFDFGQEPAGVTGRMIVFERLVGE